MRLTMEPPMTLLTRAAVFAVALLSAGCGKTTLESFITDYCAVLSTCCKEQNRPADGAQCRSLYTSTAAKSGATFDAAAADTCLAEFKAASQKAGFCVDGMSFSSTACKQVLEGTGTKQPGEACTEDKECAPSSKGEVSCEHYWEGSAEGKLCQVQMVGSEGSKPCIGTKDGTLIIGVSTSGKPPSEGYICNRANSVYCTGDGTAGCKKIQSAGGACTSDFGCDAATYCDFAKQQCVTRFATGASCADDSDGCEAAAYCDSTKKCVTKIALDGACTSSSACVTKSCINGKCAKSSGFEDLGWILICGG